MRLPHRHLLPIALAVFLCSLAPLRAADDGRRAVNVKRFGITVRVPQAWRLISWARDNQAFALKLPQDAGSKSGLVKCELGVAPEDLAEYQKQEQAADVAEQKQPQPKRRMVDNTLAAVDAKKFGERLARLGQQLTTSWQIDNPSGSQSFELCTRVVSDGTLFTFSLASDETHFEAYRLDFEEMLASAVFSRPETGLERMAGGYWMQRDFRFALRLPQGWKPAFGPSDKALFFAAGEAHDVFIDHLQVLASPPRALDLEKLKESLPGEIVKADEHAKVACRIVPQGVTFALETVVHTERDARHITTIERRFRTPQRVYEVKFTCDADEFKRREVELRKCLDSFGEVADAPRGDA